MGLADRVTARVPTVRLAQLTQAAPGSTTVDTTILGYAVDDVVADLAIYAGVTYDDDDARHVAVAVRGVLLTLLSYKGEADGEDKLERWRQDASKGLRLVTHGNRLLPKTNSPYTPTPYPAGATIRPLTDRVWVDQIVPGSDATSWLGPPTWRT